MKKALREQVEWYFSDFALPTQTRLQDTMNADVNGWVPLDSLCGYPKLNEIAQHIDFSPAVLSSALQGSSLLEINRAGDSVRRRYELGKQGHDFVPLSEEEARVWRILAAFKFSEQEEVTLDFPPASTEERATVHYIAHILGLQHRSKGSGARHRKNRYVTVTRRRTPEYDEKGEHTKMAEATGS